VGNLVNSDKDLNYIIIY